MAKELRKTKDHPDVKAMQEQREQRAIANEEAMERMDSSQPTPTQEENDRARMGEDVAHKEDDGSGPEVELHVRSKPFGQHAQQSSQQREKSEQDKQAYATRQQTPKPPSAG